MEKFNSFKLDEETRESWLEVFNNRLQGHDTGMSCDTLGRGMLKRIPKRATWDEVRGELLDLIAKMGILDFGITEKLISYSPGNNGLGDIFGIILTVSSTLRNEEERNEFALKAFLAAVPDSLGQALRRKHFLTVGEAVEEARKLREVEDRSEEVLVAVEDPPVILEAVAGGGMSDDSHEEVMAVEEDPPEEASSVETDPLLQGNTHLERGGLLEEPRQQRERKAPRKVVCWCCHEEGHVMRWCPVIDGRSKPSKARCWCCGEQGHMKRRCPVINSRSIPSKVRCWCCDREGHMMKQCPGVNSRMLEQVRCHEGTSVQKEPSKLISARVRVAGVEVDALVGTGATTSCCRWGWFQRWKAHLGPLEKSDRCMAGVGHRPVKVKGVITPKLEWDGVEGHAEMLVLPTLREVDVILGMDVLYRFDVDVDIRGGKARPKPPSLLRPEMAFMI